MSFGHPLVALAQTKSTPDEAQKTAARQKFGEGTKAFSEQRYKDAVDLYLQADAIIEDPSFAYNVASAYDRMGDRENALRWSREYLRRAPDASDRAEVQARIAQYERHLADKGVQQVTVLSKPVGATLVLDGVPAGVTPWTGEIRPGSHVARLQLAGYSDVERHFQLGAETALDVEVELTPTPMAAPPGTAAPSARPAPPRRDEEVTGKDVVADSSGGALLPLALVSAGVGVAAIGAAVGLEVARAGAERDAVDAPVQIDANAAYDRAEKFQLASRALAGVGAALSAAGVVLLVVDLSSGVGTDTAVRVGCGGLACHVDTTF